MENNKEIINTCIRYGSDPNPDSCRPGRGVELLLLEKEKVAALNTPDIRELVTQELNVLNSEIAKLCVNCPLTNSGIEEPAANTIQKKIKLPGVVSASWMKRFAISRGLVVTSGNGRHGLHIVAPTGERRPLPDHASDLSPGVTRSLQLFILSRSVE